MDVSYIQKVRTIDTSANFWKLNPELKNCPEFKPLLKKDKSRDKKDSSKQMWVITLIYYHKSPYKEMSFSEKASLAGKEVMNSETYYENNKKLLTPYIEAFLKLTETSALAQLRVWKEKMREKTEYLETLSYSDGKGEEIEKLLSSNKKLYEDYERILKSVSKEEHEATYSSGNQPSLSDEELI